MGALVEWLLDRYESGVLTRRQLVQGLSALSIGSAGAVRAQSASSTFGAVGLNHIALDVTDIPRARDFYVRHLGLEVTSESAGSCFLRCGEGNFVALFRADQAGMRQVSGWRPEECVSNGIDCIMEPMIQNMPVGRRTRR